MGGPYKNQNALLDYDYEQDEDDASFPFSNNDDNIQNLSDKFNFDSD